MVKSSEKSLFFTYWVKYLKLKTGSFCVLFIEKLVQIEAQFMNFSKNSNKTRYNAFFTIKIKLEIQTNENSKMF